ncbi:MAG: HD domain-containing protein [Bacteroidales bacterium]|nr:HD domain-containing protein [Bacteroidales bacterium]
MKAEELIALTEERVRTELASNGSGHDWYHVDRVRKTALFIAKSEGNGDLLIVELAALLHDIADHKYHNGDEEIGFKTAEEFLSELNVDKSTIIHITKIIQEISFKGAGVRTLMSTVEGKIVQDADRLDAIGAIGIARTFAYGGHKNRPMYDPNIKPVCHTSFAAYKVSTAPTINHFYEKLLMLKDLMNTKTGKAIAEKRHNILTEFLSNFYQEWDGTDYQSE